MSPVFKQTHYYETDHLACHRLYSLFFTIICSNRSTCFKQFTWHLDGSYRQHPEQAYKSCSGILSLQKKVGNERLINACRRAHGYSVYNYLIIVQVLDKKLDRLTEDEVPPRAMPRHHNIRGEQYYQ